MIYKEGPARLLTTGAAAKRVKEIVNNISSSEDGSGRLLATRAAATKSQGDC